MRRILRRGTTLLACALLVPFLAACPDQDTVPAPAPGGDVATDVQPATEQAPAELTQEAESYRQAWNGIDPAAVARFYTEEATVTVGDSTYRGRAEAQQRWITQNVQAIDNLETRDDRMEQRGNDWVQSGSYRVTGTLPDGQPLDGGGSYRTTWTRTAAGEWRIREQEVRADAPPQTT
jgi:ketosteroid isomerase-like protein